MVDPSKRCSLQFWKRAMDGITLAPIFFFAAAVTYFFAGGVRNLSGQSRTWLPRRSRSVLALVAISTLILPGLTIPLAAQGPDSIADVAERVVDAVVGISTSPRVQSRNNAQERSPSTNNDELFRDFFEGRGRQGRNNQGSGPTRLVNSLGSGFIIDAQGIVVTNNVIA